MIHETWLAEESALLQALEDIARLDGNDMRVIGDGATVLVREVRKRGGPTLLESFLLEYGLATEEGLGLMRMAEALLRVSDAATADALIADRIRPGNWRPHLGSSSSFSVNAATRALVVAQRFLRRRDENARPSLVEILTRPVLRMGARQAMRTLGGRFVLAETVEDALLRARRIEAKGFLLSYDMLGEGARTAADASRYFDDYMGLARALGEDAPAEDFRTAPGISIKLSALHPRYEYAKRETMLGELEEKVLAICLACRDLGIGLNIDAEESERLELSLELVERLASRPELASWEGLGVVVQAYGRRALPVIDWIVGMARARHRKFMIRLVKGAYWDTEIKRAQVLGIDSFPVYTRKASTDISYLGCARRLLDASDCIYPQFGTHNAHTAAAILHQAAPGQDLEFQRVYGMGEALHDILRTRHGARSRVYAPVGTMHDLLPYLVRRLLENGANSSFVSQIADPATPPETIGRSPYEVKRTWGNRVANSRITAPQDIYLPDRRNSRGFDLADPSTVARLAEARERFAGGSWNAVPAAGLETGETRQVVNPARPSDIVGEVTDVLPAAVDAAYERAIRGQADWMRQPAERRTEILNRVAELYEANTPELLALLAREAGKTWLDAVGEIREAVDFCRYYALHARDGQGRGVVACISPWNFPAAIFTGQIVGALAAGNAVLAKPAGQTALLAARLVRLMHEAGVPEDLLILLPGPGGTVGARLVGDSRLAAACLTGSTETAQVIHRAMAEGAAPTVPLVAETGGLNAMVVDATALPERTVADIVASAFQSAGQRCSAARVLYVQRDIEGELVEMLAGAMDLLELGNPWQLSTDIGPLIDAAARDGIRGYCDRAEQEGKLMHTVAEPEEGWFLGPRLLRVEGIEEVEREVFGPVLHVARFAAEDLDRVIDSVNARGYGLTMAVHSRIDSRIRRIAQRARVGNLYVNRNQIGAVVGSQPFGGEGLSGTGPKAGGPHFVECLGWDKGAVFREEERESLPAASLEQMQAAVDRVQGRETAVGVEALRGRLREALAGRSDAMLEDAMRLDMAEVELPGPAGERNRIACHPRGVILCIGAKETLDALLLAAPALATGNAVVALCARAASLEILAKHRGLPLAAVEAALPCADTIRRLRGIAGVRTDLPEARMREMRRALAAREGAIVPLLAGREYAGRFVVERTECEDTTASGGNAALFALAEEPEGGA